MIRIELLTAPGWAKCQTARALVAALIEKARSRFPDVRVEEVDVTANPEVAVKYRATATPAIAIDGTLEFTGVPREAVLRAKLEAAIARGERSP